jgi:hypothetical protein
LIFEIQLDPNDKNSLKIMAILHSHAKILKKNLEQAKNQEDRNSAIYAFYRKFYTLTLCKSCLKTGLNKSPTRDIILDYPWKDLQQNRIICLKIWEKINH